MVSLGQFMQTFVSPCLGIPEQNLSLIMLIGPVASKKIFYLVASVLNPLQVAIVLEKDHQYMNYYGDT